MVGGLASGRPELAVLVVPFLLFIGVGVAVAREPRLTGDIALDRDRLLEGEQTRATVALRNQDDSAVELELTLARSSHVALEPAGAVIVRLAAGEEITIQFAAHADRWGAHTLGPLLFTARDPLGITARNRRLERRVLLRVLPREERLRELVAPLRRSRSWVRTSRRHAERASSSPTSVRSRREILCGASTGASRRDVASCM